MDRFDCHGWLHIVIGSQPHEASIQLKHDENHLAYVNTDLPDHWKEYVEEHSRTQTPGEIWCHIVREETHGKSASEVSMPFRSKAVYYYWHVVSRNEWRRANDPLESARRFIEEKGDEYQVRLLDLEEVPETKVLAFEVTDSMKEWADHTQELAMDSTCMSLSESISHQIHVADAQGSGIPLAFLLILMGPNAAGGTKQTVLEGFLRELKKRRVDPEYTLTDKDWSEINVMHAIWPNAKHQLCFWHALRALKQRLTKSKENPAPYDVISAQEEFSFINTDFLPEMQRRTSDLVCTHQLSYCGRVTHMVI
ncbi:hypothetical protein WOLCODRAFT_81724 [Wolfiporia cocos MD-104 SS10]|uniref:Uncharacterized protein n=1 Tax=Wolfiporia cocos (strain MD-104) TaxID=742152 RepID=A0A2H3JEA6_WOLCO|nr:hypothetical protein WOLCODRAFT_81724 [Wolfiporia cocos MD-104 SS10]